MTIATKAGIYAPLWNELEDRCDELSGIFCIDI